MKKIKLDKLLVSLLVCQLAGIIGSFFTRSSVDSWYLDIIKPSFNPPDWVFAPVWTLLFLLMGVSLYLLWTSKENKKAMVFFFLQLLLNILWSMLFFGLKNPLWGFIEIIMLVVAIVVTILYSYRTSKVAAYLLFPYLGWVCFAAVLNFAIFYVNWVN